MEFCLKIVKGKLMSYFMNNLNYFKYYLNPMTKDRNNTFFSYQTLQWTDRTRSPINKNVFW